MSKYINIDLLNRDINNSVLSLENKAIVFGIIYAQPEPDVKKVVHASWDKSEYLDSHGNVGYDYICSACEESNEDDSAFCPNCGAQMDLETN